MIHTEIVGRLRRAKSILKLRAQRDTYFDADLFGEPIWDMLLDLFVAHMEGTTITTTSLCIASRVPQTTALRYISVMQEKRLIVSRKNEDDARMRILELTPQALGALNQYFDHCDGERGYRDDPAIPLKHDATDDGAKIAVNDFMQLLQTYMKDKSSIRVG